MSVTIEEAESLLKPWETGQKFECSFCQQPIFFRAEFDAEEGKRPAELLSGFLLEFPGDLRPEFSKWTKSFPLGKLAICHQCGERRVREICTEALSMVDAGGLKNIRMLAERLRRAA